MNQAYIDLQNTRYINQTIDNINRMTQGTLICELQDIGIVNIERWTYFAQRISNYYMLQALLTTDIRGVGKLSSIPDHLYVANMKHGPIGLRTLLKDGYEPSKELINQVLTSEQWIVVHSISYSKLVKSIYGSNSIMIHKWERYAEGVRSLV
jgi:hypothetical protein